VVEILTVSGFALLVVGFCFSLVSKSWHVIDRLTDKLMAERTPANFATYATYTPTKWGSAEATKFPSINGNGNGNGKHPVGVGADLESYLTEHPNLEVI
jgi:hypothetical protein